MANKSKVTLQYSEDLEAVDDELAAAMEALDSANNRVGELLEACAPPDPEEGHDQTLQDGSGGADASQGVADDAAASAPPVSGG